MVIGQHTEIERKYDVPPDARVPELTCLPGVDRVAPPDEVELDATYFDTADLALAGPGSRCDAAPVVRTPDGT